MKREAIYDGIDTARDVADEKWGEVSIPERMYDQAYRYTLATILMEEVGEVARAILERDDESLASELFDVCQVAVAALEGLNL